MNHNEGTAKKNNNISNAVLKMIIENIIEIEVLTLKYAIGATSNGHREETEMVWSCDKLTFYFQNNSSGLY